MSSTQGSEVRDFLLEIGCEEIPAWMLPGAEKHLSAALAKFLESQSITHGEIKTYSTPRRLVALVPSAAVRQEDRTEENVGPPKAIAFDDSDKPTKAAEGFARKSGVSVEELEIIQTDKGEYLCVHQTIAGLNTRELLAGALPDLILSIPFPKTMRWADRQERFVRPIRWVVALLGDELVPFEVAGVKSGSSSTGHRILGDKDVSLENSGHYFDVMLPQFVIVDPSERRTRIKDRIEALAKQAGGRVVADSGLLETVTYQVEHPLVLCGKFPERFLELPREVLITSMKHHQKYFSVEDSEGVLLACFLSVADMEKDDKGTILHGNERVLVSRLEDALFFWNEDGKTTFDERFESLAQVVFHKGLGSYQEKSLRVSKLTGYLTEALHLKGSLRDDSVEAARLCKVDLTSEMVGEFPELQGKMGGLYAKRSGLSPEMARAIYEHYQPTSASDPIPESKAGCLVALADRLDTLVGCFGVGIRPKGSKDPYALRRAALGASRIILEARLPLSLKQTTEFAAKLFEESGIKLDADGLESCRQFLRDRFKYLLEREGISYDAIGAVLESEVDLPLELAGRARALHEARGLEDLEAVMAAFKRVRNIVAPVTERHTFDASRSTEAAEQELHQATEEVARKLDEYLKEKDYSEAVRAISRTRGPVDRFFDEVLVMSEDPSERSNRLGLLQELDVTFLRFADFSRMVLPGEKTDKKANG